MAKKLDREAKKLEILAYLKKSGPVLPKAIVAAVGLPIEDAKGLVAELVEEGKIRKSADDPKLLEIVPAKKKSAPAPVAKTKKKPAPPVEEDDDDEDEEDDTDEDEDEDEDEDSDEEDEDDDWAEEDDDEDEDEGESDEEADDPDHEDETDDDEDDAPPVKKGSGRVAGSKNKPKVKAAPPEPHKAFSMSFKPIDTLSDEELTTRVKEATEAAEGAFADGFKEVAEMLMRSVARARKQLNRRK